MNIIPFKALLPKIGKIQDQNQFFESVKEDFKQFYDEDYFSAPRAAACYIYCIKSAGKASIGLVCTTLVEDYLSGKILKHEKTIHKKKQIQVELLRKRGAVVKPVLLVHRQNTLIRDWLSDYSRTHPTVAQVKFSDEEEHLLWEIQEEADIQEVQALFKEHLPMVAIADGHHRFSSIASLWKAHADQEVNPYRAVLSAYFPEDALNIETFHRLVELPEPFDNQLFFSKLRQLGTLNSLDAPEIPAVKHQMSIVLDTKWYKFTWNPDLLKNEHSQLPVLDVNLLYQHILEPLLEIQDIQANTKLHYLEGTVEAVKISETLMQLSPGIGFILYPITPSDFLKLAQLKIMLVPKATFFIPRLKNGLVIQILDGV